MIERANNSEYGLAGAVWTAANPDKGVEIAEQLETGTVWVNEYSAPVALQRRLVATSSQALAQNTGSMV